MNLQFSVSLEMLNVKYLYFLFQLAHFEQEMREFRERTGETDAVVGTKKEMLELKALSIDMDNFCTEVKTTTKVCTRILKIAYRIRPNKHICPYKRISPFFEKRSRVCL